MKACLRFRPGQGRGAFDPQSELRGLTARRCGLAGRGCGLGRLFGGRLGCRTLATVSGAGVGVAVGVLGLGLGVREALADTEGLGLTGVPVTDLGRPNSQMIPAITATATARTMARRIQ